MEDIKIHLVDLLPEVSIFPAKDLLVNVLDNKCLPYDKDGLPNNETVQSILRESRAIERKTGVSPLCLAYGVYKHEINGKTTETPVFFKHVEPKLTNSKTILFESTEELELNPFIKKLFGDDHALSTLNNFDELINTGLVSHGELDKSKVYLGNFDPKRFAFIREI